MILGRAMVYRIARNELTIKDATGVTVGRWAFTGVEAIQQLMYALGDLIEETLHFENSKDAA